MNTFPFTPDNIQNCYKISKVHTKEKLYDYAIKNNIPVTKKMIKKELCDTIIKHLYPDSEIDKSTLSYSKTDKHEEYLDFNEDLHNAVPVILLKQDDPFFLKNINSVYQQVITNYSHLKNSSYMSLETILSAVKIHQLTVLRVKQLMYKTILNNLDIKNENIKYYEYDYYSLFLKNYPDSLPYQYYHYPSRSNVILNQIREYVNDPQIVQNLKLINVNLAMIQLLPSIENQTKELTKDVLKDEIISYLLDNNLDEIQTYKEIRNYIENKYNTDLYSQKKYIKEVINSYIDSIPDEDILRKKAKLYLKKVPKKDIEYVTPNMIRRAVAQSFKVNLDHIGDVFYEEYYEYRKRILKE